VNGECAIAIKRNLLRIAAAAHEYGERRESPLLETRARRMRSEPVDPSGAAFYKLGERRAAPFAETNAEHHGGRRSRRKKRRGARVA
jgi:hypothetical protein